MHQIHRCHYCTTCIIYQLIFYRWIWSEYKNKSGYVKIFRNGLDWSICCQVHEQLPSTSINLNRNSTNYFNSVPKISIFQKLQIRRSFNFTSIPSSVPVRLRTRPDRSFNSVRVLNRVLLPSVRLSNRKFGLLRKSSKSIFVQYIQLTVIKRWVFKLPSSLWKVWFKNFWVRCKVDGSKG